MAYSVRQLGYRPDVGGIKVRLLAGQRFSSSS